MGGARSTYVRREKSIQNFGRKARREEATPEDPSLDGKIIRMRLKEIMWGHVNWIHLAQNRDQWRAHVNTVTNLRVP